MYSISKKTVVLVGDAYSGKTALAMKLSQDVFLDHYEPTSFEDFAADIAAAQGSSHVFTLLDTAGHRSRCAELRLQAYKGCDVVLVCFDLTDVRSLERIESVWVPEIAEHCGPGVPLYLVGCKRDLSCDGPACACGGESGRREPDHPGGSRRCCVLSQEEALGLTERTGAVALFECSALDSQSIAGLFQVVAAYTPTIKKRKRSLVESIASLRKSINAFSRAHRISSHF